MERRISHRRILYSQPLKLTIIGLKLGKEGIFYGNVKEIMFIIQIIFGMLFYTGLEIF